MKRRFTRRQRNLLFAESDGKCTKCGIALDGGWHADHMIPYIKQGKTLVSNGQALCPNCNIKKGVALC